MSLAGRTILVTRGAADAGAWAAQLDALGARAIAFPCIECREMRDAATRAALVDALADADWLALTSRRGVEGVSALAERARLEGVRIAAVGPATADAARRLLGRVDLAGEGGTARALGGELVRQAGGGMASPAVVVAGARTARRGIEEACEAHGWRVTRVALYETVSAAPQRPREDLAARGVDTIFLASPSAVAGLMARAVVPPGVHIVTIGPTTSAAARKAGLRVTAEAASRGLPGMIEATP